MAIGKDKRRYSVSLTPENVNFFQAMLKRLGLPPSSMSSVIDNALIRHAHELEMLLEQDVRGLSDLLSRIGTDERKIHDIEQKRDSDTRSPK